jgi:hypothetical protein
MQSHSIVSSSQKSQKSALNNQLNKSNLTKLITTKRINGQSKIETSKEGSPKDRNPKRRWTIQNRPRSTPAKQ